MTSPAAATCWGVAVCLSLLLPGSVAPAAHAGQTVPQKPPTATPPPTAQQQNQQTQAALLYSRGWEQAIDSSDGMTVAVSSRFVYIGGRSLPLAARNLTDGNAAWASAIKPTAPIVAAEGLVFVVADDRLSALDENSGKVRWSVTAVGSPGPLVHNGMVLLPTSTGVQALRAPDGSEAWKQDLARASVTRLALDGNAIYTALDDKTLVALDLATGAVRWRTAQPLQPNALSAAGGLVNMGTQEGFFCVAKQEHGRLSWCFPAIDGPKSVRAALAGVPVRHGDRLYVALLDNTLRTFNAGNGALIQREPLPARPASEPQLVGPWLVVPLSSGQFVLYSIATGKEITRLAPPRDIATLQAAAIALDGSVLITLTVSPGDLRVLATYFKK